VLPSVTFEEMLDRLTRDNTSDDPDFHRRLATSSIRHILDDLIARLPEEEQVR
jgi:hypothetical protein